MNPELQLILGCFLLSLTVTYWIWSWYRVWFFQQNLIEIGNQLRETMKAKGRADDPSCRELLLILDRVIRNASLMSISAMARLVETSEMTLELEGSSPVKLPLVVPILITRREDMPEEVAAAEAKAVGYIILHVLVGSPLFCLGLLLRSMLVERPGLLITPRFAKVVQSLPDTEEFRFIKVLLST